MGPCVSGSSEKRTLSSGDICRQEAFRVKVSVQRSIKALHHALLHYHEYVGVCVCTCECDLPPCPHLSGWPPLCGGAPAPRFWHCRSPWTCAGPERWSGCSVRPPGWTPPPLLSSSTQMSCRVTHITTRWIISASVTHCSTNYGVDSWIVWYWDNTQSTLIQESSCLLWQNRHTFSVDGGSLLL